MTVYKQHICVCVCTYKRPLLLKDLLEKLQDQITKDLFTYSIVVADNDYKQSAKDVVRAFRATSGISITYCVEPEQNIALARNRALENAEGDFVAFIDDDEFPKKDWLYRLFEACNKYGADGVLGPVRPLFEIQPAQWLIKWKSIERPNHKSGYKMHWAETRTGNVLLKREVLEGKGNRFSREFGSGSEDVDFFRRMIQKGKTFVWCNEAIVYEIVPETRCRRSYQIKLALLRGGNSLKHPTGRASRVLKSFIALPGYGLALPLLFVFNDIFFMTYMIKFCDHLGRLMAVVGLRPVKERNF